MPVNEDIFDIIPIGQKPMIWPTVHCVRMLTQELGDCTWFGRLRARLRAPARHRVRLARAAALLLALVTRLARVRLLGAAVHLGAAPRQRLLHLVHHGGHPAPAATSAPASVSGVPAHSSVPAEQESKVIIMSDCM